MANRWATLARMPRAERRLLLQALVLLPLTSAALRIVGLRAWQTMVGTLATLGASPAADADRYTRSAARMVRLASVRGLTRPLCLSRSVVLWTLLRRAGIASEIRIGVRKRDGALDAHAWVERNGLVINDRRRVGESFAPFTRGTAPLSNSRWTSMSHPGKASQAR
jgi:hypothetical protein